jgi:hypothetical protein
VTDIYWGDALIKQADAGGDGELVLREGEVFYKITNYHTMPAFFVAVVSSSDHWMFVSSTGGLTCGRKNPDSALFPYYTDDKIHDAGTTTGPQTILLVEKNTRTQLWKPFGQDLDVYRVERNLFKNLAGTKLIFEELNHSLGLVFSYQWANSEKFGFVRTSTLRNVGDVDLQVNVLDGLRNLLPYGVTQQLQNELSTLVDAYKQAEAFEDRTSALYTMSSTLTDLAEPSEALNATVVWSAGLENPCLLLSEDQVDAFCAGLPLTGEVTSNGKRGAFYVQSAFTVLSGDEKIWLTVADINRDASEVSALFSNIDQGISALTIERDVEAGSQRLLQLVGGADGCQLSSDALVAGRHFSNTLFNIMRGGTFYDDYRFPLHDFLDFVGLWNKPLKAKFESLLGSQGKDHNLASVLAVAEASGDADMERMVLEYLPLTFSRRHGDPSRPWNRFSIDIKNPDGSDKLYYQGNWRDIFQNWEALTVSYPEFAESFISKFVNASTVDGYNPYRITKEGFEWEVLSPDDPWSNIGYWGDHQVNYLLKLIELSCHYHPGKIETYLGREIFVYADVPYRLKAYQSLMDNPRDSVFYDEKRAVTIADRVGELGSDGKLLSLADGSIYKVNLMEKLLVTALSKLSNFVPGGGIWMNTQRPEWNDANNALAGYGLSMVTLCYLRRFLVLIEGLVDGHEEENFAVSIEVLSLFDAIEEVFKKYTFVLEAAIRVEDRKSIMDELGYQGEQYRESVYTGFSGNKSGLGRTRLLAFVDQVKAYLDHSIALSRREDGLFHAYNLIQFDAGGYAVENLYEMLEGQVAVLSSGYLDARDSLDLLTALRSSKMYRSDQNSYVLYPDRKLPLFQEKNVIPQATIEGNTWIQHELNSGRSDFIEQDVNGIVHFNGSFKNAEELRACLEKDTGISEQDRDVLCDVYETIFNHRQFTGRSGTMFKYEGLGCIYWHMVSKLLLATGEVIESAGNQGVDQELANQLLKHFDDIKDGLGLHKSPAQYGAFPVDPYSHTTGFSGVQQPGMTGQVKEDVITRFNELGVNVTHGEISFSPLMLKRQEFISEPRTWHFSVGGPIRSENLDTGSLAFSLCGVPVIYRLAQSSSIQVHLLKNEVEVIEGNVLGVAWSQSLFKREKRVLKLVVDIPVTQLRA